MRRSTVFAALALGTTLSRAAWTAGESNGSTGFLEPGWNLVSVSFDGAEIPAPWRSQGIRIWPVSRGNAPTSRVDWPSSHSPGGLYSKGELFRGGYWVYADTGQAYEIQEVPSPLKPFSSIWKSGWRFLETGEADSKGGRLVRWDSSLSTYVPVGVFEDPKPGVGYFGFYPARDNPEWSGVSGAVPGAAASDEQARAGLVEAGQFEPSAVLTTVRGSGRLTRTALSQFPDRVFAHVAYAVRGHGRGGGDEIRYHQSDEAGKPGSFSLAHGWSLPNVDSARDLALSARGSRVSIAWIAYRDSGTQAGAKTQARVVVVQSENGGQSFGRRTTVRVSDAWKRGLAMAYDAHLNHHLVWGEANKAYYLRNLDGAPANVFDQEPLGRGGADGIEPNPGQTYRFERQVLHPSLHVGNDTVSIVARQTRLWDPRPVVQPAWAAAYDGGAIPGVEGWREGTWHEADEILLAQRRLKDGQTAQKRPDGTAPPGGLDKQQAAEPNAWRVSTVALVGAGAGDNQPSYPKLVAAPWGLVVVYEDGASANPNRRGHNAIRYQSSVDGGASWSTSQTIGTGYVPTVGVSKKGDIRALYYEPGLGQRGSIVGWSRDGIHEPWRGPTRFGSGRVKPIHWQSHGEGSDSLEGGVSLATQSELFFAAWIEQVEGRDRIVTSRASRSSEVVRYSLQVPERLTEGESIQISVAAENAYSMRVNSSDVVQVHAASSVFSADSATSLIPEPSTEAQSAEHFTEGGAHFAVPLIEGTATFFADPSNLQISGPAGLAELSTTPITDGMALLEGASGSPRLQFSASVDGNYEKAKWLRDQLWREGPLSSEGQPTGFQVEYQAVREGARATEGQAVDSSFLAKHERVWAYTQGIALAQYARIGSPDGDARAQALARTLCARAVRSVDSKTQTPVIQGWPFSWNTREDTWADARLVLGATAWVVHGLGLFLVSEAFQSLGPEEQSRRQDCYREALYGLEAHRRVVMSENGRRYTLMSAGWTAQGLVEARSPWKLKGPDGAPLAMEDEGWDYYDILDAIGYAHFDSEAVVQVARTYEGETFRSDDENRVLPPKNLTEDVVRVLKQKVQAENIVTEHNLDVLAVLNHALQHAALLGLDDVAHLTEWRDGLRRGIFRVLWDRDDRRWRQELEGALVRNDTNPEKQADIRAALSRGDWGRVVTGGELRERTEASERVFDFIPNKNNTAIDNCSWLSLSVDYAALTNQKDVDALARCLEFTALAFGKDIAFRGKTYYGAHYFFDGFEDRYIDATDRQEQSYHLEATAGLIMGLLAFARHHPDHPKSDFFGQEALRLWGGVQTFVRDHDFPYSSQRIVDLSTLLISSTALIWFIDSYQAFNEHELPMTPDGAENDPATASATVVVPPFGGAFLLGSQNLLPEAGPSSVVQLSVLKWFLQITGPQLVKEPIKELVKASVTRGAGKAISTQAGKGVGQVLVGEVILTGLGGTILGAEASRALLEFVEEHHPVSVHNIYVWTSDLPVEPPAGFKAIHTDVFLDLEEVQSMSLAEKALLAEWALSPIDWSAPATWGRDHGPPKPLVDLARVADMPTDIIVRQGRGGVDVFYGPRTSNVGGYVIELRQNGVQVLDRHSGDSSSVSAELSPIELAALLRLPELIREWILRAPEPSQRGLLEEYLSQWIFSVGANPVPPSRFPSSGLPTITGTSKEVPHDSDSDDLFDKPLSEADEPGPQTPRSESFGDSEVGAPVVERVQLRDGGRTLVFAIRGDIDIDKDELSVDFSHDPALFVDRRKWMAVAAESNEIFRGNPIIEGYNPDGTVRVSVSYLSIVRRSAYIEDVLLRAGMNIRHQRIVYVRPVPGSTLYAIFFVGKGLKGMNAQVEAELVKSAQGLTIEEVREKAGEEASPFFADPETTSKRDAVLQDVESPPSLPVEIPAIRRELITQVIYHRAKRSGDWVEVSFRAPDDVPDNKPQHVIYFIKKRKGDDHHTPIDYLATEGPLLLGPGAEDTVIVSAESGREHSDPNSGKLASRLGKDWRKFLELKEEETLAVAVWVVSRSSVDQLPVIFSSEVVEIDIPND